MRALLLADDPTPLLRACEAAGCAVTRVRTVAEGRALLSRSRFELVDGRIARPPPLEDEIQGRLDLFFERLGGHPSGGLYQAVMREVERPLLAGALGRARGVRSTAARALGIDRGTLARRLRALGMDR
ncbi:MAG TPA: helix-turn-helix domain-containing protein [Anaeromyxobacteraceae bacterium]|nr:helix-turn-helix domain-containing protein [Anaeromyxobacteraceae bacterium]